MKKIELSQNEINNIIFLFVNKDMNISEISRDTNIGRPQIRRILEDNGVYKDKRKVIWSEDDDNKLKSMYNEFYTIQEIADEFSMSIDKIKKRAKTLNLSKNLKRHWLTNEIKETLSNWNGEVSVCQISRDIGVASETVRDYLKSIGKDTSIYRVKNPTSPRKVEITSEITEMLNNPRLPAWYIADQLNVSDTWVHKQRKSIFPELVIMRNTINSFSRAEHKVYKILEELDLTYFFSHEIDGYSIDFYLGNKLCIEIQGDYWHSKPKAIEKDKNKYEYLTNKGYKILYIYEKKDLASNLNQVKYQINRFWASHISDNM